LCATPTGRAAVARSIALAPLVALAAEGAPTRPSAVATSIAVLCCCAHEDGACSRLVTLGALQAAVEVLRRADSTAMGSERALGLIHVLATALPKGQRGVLRDAACVAVVHEVATKADGSAQLRRRAAECMAQLVDAVPEEADGDRDVAAVGVT
jgi:hypothetical protein